MKHIVSFARSPIGYALNLMATVLVYCEQVPLLGSAARVMGDALANPCDALCLRDGVQDDMLF